MQDSEKEASEAVIEGKAKVRAGRKKSYHNPIDENETVLDETVLDEEFAEEFAGDDAQEKPFVNKVFTTFSVIKWGVFIAITISVIGSAIWVFNTPILFTIQDNQDSKVTIDILSQELLESGQQRALLASQIDDLATQITKINNQQQNAASPISSDALDTILLKIEHIESRIDKLQLQTNQTPLVISNAEDSTKLGSAQAFKFLKILWMDSQTGRNLSLFPSRLENLQKTYRFNDNATIMLSSIRGALQGNLASHDRVLSELNNELIIIYKGSADFGLREIQKNQPELGTENSNRSTNESDIIQKPNFPLISYLAELVNLRKLSDENNVITQNQDQDQDQNQNQNQNQNQAIKQISDDTQKDLSPKSPMLPATLPQAIKTLMALNLGENKKISSENKIKLELLLEQIQSRQKVDAMIDDVHRNYINSLQRNK